MSELLELRGVSKSYPGGNQRVRVLKDASLSVAPREIVAVMGSRREGKTTLLKVASGLEPPDGGQVLFDGTDLASCADKDRARLLGHDIAWASWAPSASFSVLDYLTLPTLMTPQSTHREAKARALEALELVGAQGCASRRWRQLSSWERALTALARAVVGRPRLLVLDDLFDGLGTLGTHEAGDLLASLAREVGCAALISASDAEPAMQAERIYCLEGGVVKPVADGASGVAEVIDFPVPRREVRTGGAGSG